MLTNQTSAAIDLRLIDQELATRRLFLRFPAILEATFELDVSAQRLRRLALGCLVGVSVYDLLIVSDWWLTPDVLSTALWVRFGLMTPLSLIFAWVFLLGPSRLATELIIAVLGAVVPAAAHLYVMLCSISPYRYAQHEAIFLIILFIITVQRIRFSFAVPTCFACLLLHSCAIGQLSEYPFELKIAADVCFLGMVVLSLFVSYCLERDCRLNYLLSLKSRLQNLELDELSHWDALTGLQNRRSLGERLTALCAKGCEVSVVIADIDHFKKLNDTAGHQAGDKCLEAIGGLLKATLPDDNAEAFRYGGEEFLILLPGRDAQAAHLVAEGLRAAVEGADIPHPGLPGIARVTASFGVASGRAANVAEMDALIGGCDVALYEAKRNGRNRIWPPIAKLPLEGERNERRFA